MQVNLVFKNAVMVKDLGKLMILGARESNKDGKVSTKVTFVLIYKQDTARAKVLLSGGYKPGSILHRTFVLEKTEPIESLERRGKYFLLLQREVEGVLREPYLFLRGTNNKLMLELQELEDSCHHDTHCGAMS